MFGTQACTPNCLSPNILCPATHKQPQGYRPTCIFCAKACTTNWSCLWSLNFFSPWFQGNTVKLELSAQARRTIAGTPISLSRPRSLPVASRAESLTEYGNEPTGDHNRSQRARLNRACTNAGEPRDSELATTESKTER